MLNCLKEKLVSKWKKLSLVTPRKLNILKLSFSIVVIALILNLVWENLHDPLYESYRPFMKRWFFLGCSLGDVLLTFMVYWLVAGVLKDARWIRQFGGREIMLSLVFSIFIATTAEWIAIKLHLWSYNEKMPLIPLIRIGLTPFFQITLLPTLTFYLVQRIR